MKVSILVHNLDRADDLRRCLDSVCRQTYRPLELVLLDAGSTDNSLNVIGECRERLRECGIEMSFVSCSLMGVAASRDLAAARASGELLTFLDNDAILDATDTIQRAAAKFASDSRVGIVAFRVLERERTTIDRATWVYRRSADRWASVPFLTFTFAGGGCCIRSNLFASLGGFWQALRYAREEEDLAIGLIDAGYQILYAPDVVIRHFPSPRGRSSINERRWIELRNGLLVLWRRFPMPIAISAIVVRVGSMCIKVVLRKEGSVIRVFSAIQDAVVEWNRSRLTRKCISWQSTVRYAALHFTDAYGGHEI